MTARVVAAGAAATAGAASTIQLRQGAPQIRIRDLHIIRLHRVRRRRRHKRGRSRHPVHMRVVLARCELVPERAARRLQNRRRVSAPTRHPG